MTPTASSTAIGDSAQEPIEGELARFFGYSHDVLAIMDDGGQILVISPSVERVLGYSIEDTLGRHFLRWVHPADRSVAKSAARSLRDERSIADLDTRARRADGVWVAMRWSFSVGLHGRIYAVGRDRTAEVRHQDALLRHESAELRLRTAMELHDGILQTLTGASFQIAVARRLVAEDPARAEEVLRQLGESVAAEQREIRLYVDEIKGNALDWRDGLLRLGERIETIVNRVGMIWNVDTSVDARVDDPIPAEMGRQVIRICQEATVNAIRHGGAEAVSVAATVEDEHIHITIKDNGTGFPFKGEYDDEALRKKRLGPLSLKHRVAEAGGLIAIGSTPHGSTVTIRLPMEGEGTS